MAKKNKQTKTVEAKVDSGLKKTDTNTTGVGAPISGSAIQEKSVATNGNEREQSRQLQQKQSDECAQPSVESMDPEMKPLNKSSSKIYGQPSIANSDSLCKICSKHVYHMEQIKAVKAVFHKACFRCTDCSKPLSLDTYSSHEGRIYCKPHFKQIFQPQPVFTADQPQQPQTPTIGTDQPEAPSTPVRAAAERKKFELIIAENQPLELPADVVRSSTKSEEIFENINLDLSNIRNRFENGGAATQHQPQSETSTKKPQISRAESIHKIMQRYQNRVAGEKDMSDDEETTTTCAANVTTSDKNESGPESLTFTGLSSLKSQWETGSVVQKNDSARVNDELEEIRQKAKDSAESGKNAYERAVQEKTAEARHDSIQFEGVKASGIKEKFEKGQFEAEPEEDRIERMRKEREAEMSQYAKSETCTNDARNKFKQIEQGGAVNSSNASAANEDVSISSQELQNRFNYFENLKENQTPKTAPSADQVDDCPKVDITKKMLDKFKALESGQNNGADNEPKVKRITPPREIVNERKVFESEPIPDDPNVVKSSYKTEDKIEVEPEKAKNLRAKFENWQSEIKNENRKNGDEEEEFVPTNGASKNLRAMFESIRSDGDKPVEKPRPRINRFVENSAASGAESCFVCASRLYPMEKMEFSGIKIHKNCFRCHKCHCMLRLDNFTVHAEKLFCIPHFKQMFMEKGNYDEGFGLEQHKDKWANKTPAATPAKSVPATATTAEEEEEEEKTVATPSADVPAENGNTNGSNGYHHSDDEEIEVEVEEEDEQISLETSAQNGHCIAENNDLLQSASEPVLIDNEAC